MRFLLLLLLVPLLAWAGGHVDKDGPVPPPESFAGGDRHKRDLGHQEFGGAAPSGGGTRGFGGAAPSGSGGPGNRRKRDIGHQEFGGAAPSGGGGLGFSDDRQKRGSF